MTNPADKADIGRFDIELLLKQARSYLAFGEQTRQFSERYQDALREEADGGAALHRHFDRFREALAQSATEPGINPELAQLWTLNLDTWQQATTALGIPLAVLPEGYQTGPWADYQRAQRDYLELLRQAALAALDLMEQQLGERVATGNTPSSLRELYNLWVDCNEATYGRMLRSADYPKISGRLLNALVACYRKDAVPP